MVVVVVVGLFWVVEEAGVEQVLAPLVEGEAAAEVGEGQGEEGSLVLICSEPGADPSSWKYFDSDDCSLDMAVVALP